MSEIRYNPLECRHVIISEERSQRPFNRTADEKVRHDRSLKKADCPFCEGNEEQTPREVYSLRNNDTSQNAPGWEIRVVPNKYSVVTPDANENRNETGIFSSSPGKGFHEVIIETPYHEISLSDLYVNQVFNVLKTYRCRLNELTERITNGYVSIFKNHGAEAGASISHTHSQIIGTHFIPSDIAKKLEVLTNFYNTNKRCLICDIIDKELKAGERLVYLTERFLIHVPYWAGMPLEVYITPTEHNASFLDTSDDDLKELAEILKSYLLSLRSAAGDVPYNLLLALAPVNKTNEKLIGSSFHWYLNLVPRLTKYAGFELSTGIKINTSSPEYSATILKKEIKSII